MPQEEDFSTQYGHSKTIDDDDDFAQSLNGANLASRRAREGFKKVKSSEFDPQNY